MTKLKVLLVDVDSTIPNIALMRLSRYYKDHGYDIELRQLNISIYKHLKTPIVIDTANYCHVFVSTIFKGTMDGVSFSNMDNVDIGGTGSGDIHKTLPDVVDRYESDYSIYPDCDTSVGFLSRGCIRNCEFCVVHEKEGKLRQVANIDDIVRHKKVKFLDNNFLALPNHIELLKELIVKKIRCQFNQGLDIRLVTEENAKLLSELNYFGEYVFAFDYLSLKPIVEKNLAILKKYIPQDWKIKFFIYCHPDLDIPCDVYYRILWCKKRKVLPYFMRHSDCWLSEEKTTYNDFSAWCNQPGIFKHHTYEEFCKKRRANKPYPQCCPEWYLKLKNDMETTI
jgi:hypothetical protein